MADGPLQKLIRQRSHLNGVTDFLKSLFPDMGRYRFIALERFF